MLKVTDLLSRNLWWMTEESWNQNSRSEYEKTHKSTSSLYLECSVRQRELDAWPRGWVNILRVWWLARESCCSDKGKSLL